jgi:PAS domain S-box-containing protein
MVITDAQRTLSAGARMPTTPRTWTSRRAGAEPETTLPPEGELGRFWSFSPSLLAIVAYDGTVRQINDAWCQALSWGEEEIVGRPLVDLVHPDDVDAVRSATLEVTSGNASAGFEARLALQDGGWRAFLFSASPAPDALAYLVGSEFEERRAAERLLAAERAVASILNEALGLEETIPRLLRVIGDELEWDVVSWWEADQRSDVLRSSHIWHRLGDRGHALEADAATRGFARGIDLPGRVWDTGQAAWVENLQDEGDVARSNAVREAGLHTALALPVGTRDHVTGVLELVSCARRAPHPETIGALRAIAGQLGQFVDRLRAETARRLFVGILESIPEPAMAVDVNGVILTANGAVERLYGYRPEELIGRPMTILMAPEAAATERSIIDRVFEGDVIEDFETERLSKDGTAVAVALTLAPMRDADGTVMAAGGIHVDVRERRARDAALERALRRLSASTEVLLAIGGRTDPESVLSLIAERGRSLVDARSVIIALADEQDLVVSAIAGAVPEETAGARVAAEGTLPGESLRTHRLERLADARAEMGPFLDALGLDAEAAMLVPLTFRGEALGVLIALDRADGPAFGREDEGLMVSFAAGAATAVATTRSVEEDLVHAQLASAEREHRRWARDLHDQTLQGLHGLQMLLTTALRDGGEETVRAAAQQAVEFLGSEIDELRGIITDVRPATLDEIGLEAALLSLTDRVASKGVIEVQPEIELAWEEGRAEERLAPEIEATIYRCLQEALTNVTRHSHADRARVRVVEKGPNIVVEVIDDGVGFDPAAKVEGVGLVGMRERATLVGGRVDIDSGHGETVVRVQLPARHQRA